MSRGRGRLLRRAASLTPRAITFCLRCRAIQLTQLEMADHVRRSALVRDGGTLQIGIGALSDALVHALLLRQRNADAYRSVLAAIGSDVGERTLADQNGMASIRSKRGLYGASEMVMDGLRTSHAPASFRGASTTTPRSSVTPPRASSATRFLHLGGRHATRQARCPIASTRSRSAHHLRSFPNTQFVARRGAIGGWQRTRRRPDRCRRAATVERRAGGPAPARRSVTCARLLSRFERILRAGCAAQEATTSTACR